MIDLRRRIGGIPGPVVAFLGMLLAAAAVAFWILGDRLLPTQAGAGEGDPGSGGRVIEEIRRFRAPEAHQGVAVDGTHFFAIGNRIIAKYDRRTGRKVAEWRAGPGDRFVHLNSCVVADEELVCAHSNYPNLPMRSSIERWDPESMEHLGSRELGEGDLPPTGGSLTWAVPRGGDWWLGFAHYDTGGGEPDRGTEWSRVVRMRGGRDGASGDRLARRPEAGAPLEPVATYRYPPDLVDRLRPFSASGAGWGPEGLLWITGHDEAAVYVLRVPTSGSELEWVRSISAPMHGQAWAFDPEDSRTVWGIVRSRGEVVVGRLVTR